MKLLAEIYNKDIGLLNRNILNYQLRKVARAVLFNNNKIALMFVSKNNYHKLTGGGLDKNETPVQALIREIDEETGCDLELKKDIGIIIEYRDNIKLLQISYCYLANIKGELKSMKLEKNEIEEGFQLKWINLNQAINLLKKDKPKINEGKFIVKRDLIFLEEAKKMVGR